MNRPSEFEFEVERDNAGDEVQLGSGSYGTVFAAILKSTGQQVAVKRVVDAGGAEEAINEISVLEAIGSHPHIVQILTSQARNPECIFFVMPLAVHGTLEDIANLDNPLVTIDDSQNILRQLYSALAYIHDTLNIAHCDVATTNVLVLQCAPLHLNLCDFGCAGKCNRETGRLLVSDQVDKDVIYCRTRHTFASPQCLACQFANDLEDSRPNSFKCDVWAAGMTVVEFAIAKIKHRSIWVDTDDPAYTRWQTKSDQDKIRHLRFLDNLQLQQLLALRVFCHSENDRASASEILQQARFFIWS